MAAPIHPRDIFAKMKALFHFGSNIPGVRPQAEGAAPPFAPKGTKTGGGYPPPLIRKVAKDQTFSAGMICFFRLMMPGRTTMSPVTVQPNEASAIFLTRSFGTSSVASSFRMSMMNSST